MLVAGMAVWRCGWLGGGDVKLIAALSLWAGADQLPVLLLAIGVSGGALAVAILLARRLGHSAGAAMLLESCRRLPPRRLSGRRGPIAPGCDHTALWRGRGPRRLLARPPPTRLVPIRRAAHASPAPTPRRPPARRHRHLRRAGLAGAARPAGGRRARRARSAKAVLVAGSRPRGRQLRPARTRCAGRTGRTWRCPRPIWSAARPTRRSS